jgi:hypothetical protein
LGAGPDALFIPEHDLIALVAAEIEDVRHQVGMAIVEEHRDAGASARQAHHLAHVAGEQAELLAVATRIDGEHRAADRLVLREHLASASDSFTIPAQVFSTRSVEASLTAKQRGQAEHQRHGVVRNPEQERDPARRENRGARIQPGVFGQPRCSREKAVCPTAALIEAFRRFDQSRRHLGP